MNILDRLLGHDHWTTRHLLERCQEVPPAQLHTEFDLGHVTLQATLEHVLGNLETWTDLLLQYPLSHFQTTAKPDSTIAEMLARWDAAYSRFAAFARRAEAEGRLDELWTDVLDDSPTQRTIGGTIVHVITHNMHHRGEIQHMLTRLGIAAVIEGDALSWERQHGNKALPFC